MLIVLHQIKAVMPHACIGCRRYCWFPWGNRRRIFDHLSFLSELDIAYLHVFTYSERPNTEAVNFEGEVPQVIRNKRS